MKKETKLLKQKALNSLTLCVGHFNSTSDTGRVEAVLHFLDHSFEMLLKAAILHRGSKIRDPRQKRHHPGSTPASAERIPTARSSSSPTSRPSPCRPSTGLRDAAQHHLVDISEGHLYLHAQAGITLFRDLLDDVFDDSLPRPPARPRVADLDHRPTRPDRPLHRGDRRGRPPAQARHASQDGGRGAASAPSPSSTAPSAARSSSPARPTSATSARRSPRATASRSVFPGIAAVDFVTEGTGPTLSLRIAKKEGVPVHLVPEGAEDAGVVAPGSSGSTSWTSTTSATPTSPASSA